MNPSERVSTFPRLIVLFGAVSCSLVIAGSSHAPAASASPEVVQRGAYLAIAGDCIACHTAAKGEPYAGGAPFDISVGRVYSTNITPDLETGIGHYSLDNFAKVMREGVTDDGEHLYPAMPYPSYAKLSQEDIVALYAFFMQSVKPVHNPNQDAKLSGLFGNRSLMAIWNVFYLKRGEYVADSKKNGSWNRGAYLVQALGHCGDCHTPRGIAGQMKAESEKRPRHYLVGATLENWHASPLTGDTTTGLGRWSKDDIVEYLKTGRTARVAASGIMVGVVGKSTQYLTDQDLMAIAEYLKSVPPLYGRGQRDAKSKGQSDDTAATIMLREGDTHTRGALVYVDNCSACHASDGQGAKRTFPNLSRNEAVNAHDPTSLIHIVLAGSSMPSTQTAPSALAMPDFGWRLSDAEVSDVIGFVRSSWGNHAGMVDPREVGRVRKAIDKVKASQ